MIGDPDVVCPTDGCYGHTESSLRHALQVELKIQPMLFSLRETQLSKAWQMMYTKYAFCKSMLWLICISVSVSVWTNFTPSSLFLPLCPLSHLTSPFLLFNYWSLAFFYTYGLLPWLFLQILLYITDLLECHTFLNVSCSFPVELSPILFPCSSLHFCLSSTTRCTS